MNLPPDTIRTARARYSRVAEGSLARWLAAPAPRTLVFSDTHLTPVELDWSEDAPEDLVALIEALGDHEVLSLGDLTESVGLGARARESLPTAPRLSALWSLLARRRARLVPGNHDESALPALSELFSGRFLPGGFSLGRVVVRHGHERSPVETALVRAVGPAAVPVYERARRLLRRGPERLTNEHVLGRVRQGAPFVLFGHSHRAGLCTDEAAGAWANPGCFLRTAQSFLVIEGEAVALYHQR